MRSRSVVAVLLVANVVSAQTILDIIPENAGAAIALPSIKRVKEKGERFIKRADLNPFVKPSDALDWGLTFIGLSKSADYDAPVNILWLRPDPKEKSELENLVKRYVVSAPIKDIESLARDLKMDAAALKKGEIVTQPLKEIVGAVQVDRKYAYIASEASTLKARAGSPPLTKSLTEATRKRFEQSDILVHFAPRRFDEEHMGKVLGDIWGKLRTQIDSEDDRVRQDLIASLQELKFVLGGVRLEDHLEGNLSTILNTEKPPVRQFLQRLVDEGKPSNVRGLSEERLMFAQAHAGQGRTTAVLGKMMFEAIITESFEANGFLSPSDRPTFAAVFGEMWGKMKASRLGVYVPKNPAPDGLATIAAIFDVDDPKEFVSEMKTLARIAEGSLEDLTKPDAPAKIDLDKLVAELGNPAYRIRQSATTRLMLMGEPALTRLRTAESSSNTELSTRARKLREQIEAVIEATRKETLAGAAPPTRPRFTFVAAAEKRHGASVDVIKIRFETPSPAAVKRMVALLGPDWDKMRLAIVGAKIVVGFGSDVEPFDAALANVVGDRPGLDGSKELAAFRKFASPNRSAEFHVALQAGMSLMKEGSIDPRLLGQGYTSLGLATDTTGLHLELTAPPTDVKTVAKIFGW